jgi:hypothetical protein
VIRYGKQELLSSDKTTDRRDEESQDVEVGEILASIEESRVIDQKKNGDANIPCPSLFTIWFYQLLSNVIRTHLSSLQWKHS